MATWTDLSNNNVWTFDDGKLNPFDWFAEDTARAQEWADAMTEHLAARELNPPQNGTKVGVMFGSWIQYANAKQQD